METDIIHYAGILPGLITAVGVLLRRKDIIIPGILSSSALVISHLIFSENDITLTKNLIGDFIGIGSTLLATVFRKPITWEEDS